MYIVRRGVCVDGILVVTRLKLKQSAQLCALFGRIGKHGLAVAASKCELGKLGVTSAGHVFSSSGVIALPDKVISPQILVLIDNYDSLPAWSTSIDVSPLISRKFLPPPKDLLQEAKRKFAPPKPAKQAFTSVKNPMVKIAPPMHPHPAVPTSVITGAFNTAVAAASQTGLRRFFETICILLL